MTNLKHLIHALEEKYKIDDPSIRVIKYPKLLISSLKELDEIIGMEDMKNKVSSELISLIQDMNSNEERDQLHTILSGGPGIGKTTVAIKLAKVWYSLGYLKRPSSKERFNDLLTMNDPNFQYINMAYFVILYFSYIIFIQGGMSFKKFLMVILVVTLIYLVVAVAYYFMSGDEDHLAEAEAEGLINERDLINVVSREDFIGQYVGWSEDKVLKLLNSSRGKVLFIDEAYSLMADHRDPFGKPILDILNRFMLEHKDEIIIIFAGYKDKIADNLFSVQPGLQSRFKWYFDLKPYTSEELKDILKLKAYQLGYSLSGEDQIEKEISKNYDLFEYQGRDVEKLLMFCKVRIARREMEESGISFERKKHHVKHITPEIVKDAMVTLKSNSANISEPKNNKIERTFENLLKDLKIPETA